MDDITLLAKLREPFPPNQISKLPKPTKKQTEDVRTDFKKGIRCTICGAWHHPDVVHLDYVGHAALTDRLLDTDMAWSWEPLALNDSGLPAIDSNGGMWIKLTVCGVTRLGYGSADGKSGGDAVKEIIGDALRNAAMRFGAALDLWHKGDLHVDDVVAEAPSEPAKVQNKARERFNTTPGPMQTVAAAHAKYNEIVRDLHACGDSDMLEAFLISEKAYLDQFREKDGAHWNGDGGEFSGLKAEIDLAKDRIAVAELN